jgi:hypothetical protein
MLGIVYFVIATRLVKKSGYSKKTVRHWRGNVDPASAGLSAIASVLAEAV